MIVTTRKSFFVITAFLSFVVSGKAFAVLEIEITQGVEAAAPIAIVGFPWMGPGQPPSTMVGAVVRNDLNRSGRFRPLSEADIIEKPTRGSDVNWATWRLLKANYLVIGRINPGTDGGYVVEFELYDVLTQERMLGNAVAARPGELRRVAHHVSDLIFERILGIRGAFSTKIAYITATGVADELRYALVVADADGFGPQEVVRSKEPLLSPSWSPDGRHLAYVSFEKGNSSIYVQEIATGSRQQLSGLAGINGAPDFSPDGRQLAMTLSKDGDPEIYIMTIATGGLRRVTNHWAIDTEPRWMPDGRSLIFTSDRGGRPQIYEIPVLGGTARRLTFEGQYNARATVSADGRLIGMVHGNGNIYKIAVMDRVSGVLTVLSSGSLDESPSFAPNGSMILYGASEGRRGVLAAVSVDGGVRQRLVFSEGDVREPAWSPFSPR